MPEPDKAQNSYNQAIHNILAKVLPLKKQDKRLIKADGTEHEMRFNPFPKKDKRLTFGE